jgi:hypothetical protein
MHHFLNHRDCANVLFKTGRAPSLKPLESTEKCEQDRHLFEPK